MITTVLSITLIFITGITGSEDLGLPECSSALESSWLLCQAGHVCDLPVRRGSPCTTGKAACKMFGRVQGLRVLGKFKGAVSFRKARSS